jgi:hypothetical protein
LWSQLFFAVHHSSEANAGSELEIVLAKKNKIDKTKGPLPVGETKDKKKKGASSGTNFVPCQTSLSCQSFYLSRPVSTSKNFFFCSRLPQFVQKSF